MLGNSQKQIYPILSFNDKSTLIASSFFLFFLFFPKRTPYRVPSTPTTYQPLSSKTSVYSLNKMAKDFDFSDANSTDPSKHMAPPFDISQFTGGFSYPGAGAFSPAAPADDAAAEE